MSSLQYFDDKAGKAKRQEFNYSQAVIIGDIVKCSGQGGWNEDNVIESMDDKRQIDLAFESVDRVLRTVGLRGWEDVYSVRSYHLDLPGTVEYFSQKFKERIPGHCPLWTCVGVTVLGDPAMRVEIEVEAYRGKN
ncbi:Endoribonuclease L-PSP/chorismate mutase-like protein [Rhizoctonia solani]|nr:Endoribonuclease L-PSP/chorismate mutase-like protein [Rhizoctonia solani]